MEQIYMIKHQSILKNIVLPISLEDYPELKANAYMYGFLIVLMSGMEHKQFKSASKKEIWKAGKFSEKYSDDIKTLIDYGIISEKRDVHDVSTFTIIGDICKPGMKQYSEDLDKYFTKISKKYKTMLKVVR